MAALYSGTSVSGYNSNPPPDDGTTGANNQITWTGIKSKLGDPLNTFAGSVNTNITSAFNKTVGGGSLVSTGVSYPMSAADQGRLISASASGITITTPDATSVLNPFCFAVNNPSSASITIAGFGGTQNVDGQTTQTILSGGGCIVWTDGSNWFTSGLTPAQLNFTIKPQGYLTLSSDVTSSIITADVTSVASVYYNPIDGNLVPVYNGTLFKNYSFAQLGLVLVSNHLASNIYDVFIFLNAGAPILGTGPAWNNSTAGSCARGTGAGTTELQRTNGLLTNKNTMTMRNGSTTYAGIAAGQATYVGSLFIDAVAGQVSCHRSYGQSRKWGVWNAYNRIPIYLKAGDNTASWTDSAAAIRASNSSSANSLTTFSGLAEELLDIRFIQRVQFVNATTTSNNMEVGIGWNSTSAFSGTAGFAQISQSTGVSITVNQTVMAEYLQVPQLGINVVTSLEQNSTNVVGGTLSGTEQFMLLSALWRG